MPLNESQYLNQPSQAMADTSQDRKDAILEQLSKLGYSPQDITADDLQRIIDQGLSDVEDVQEDIGDSGESLGFDADDYSGLGGLFDMGNAPPITQLGYQMGGAMTKGTSSLLSSLGNFLGGSGSDATVPSASGAGSETMPTASSSSAHGAPPPEDYASADFMRNQAEKKSGGFFPDLGDKFQAWNNKRKWLKHIQDKQIEPYNISFDVPDADEEYPLKDVVPDADPGFLPLGKEWKPAHLWDDTGDSEELSPSDPNSPFYDATATSEELPQDQLAGSSIAHEDEIAYRLGLTDEARPNVGGLFNSLKRLPMISNMKDYLSRR